jgi:hypothetical protein
MSAWGSGSFENDDAADWIAMFCEDPGKESIVDAFMGVVGMKEEEYLEAPECSIAIAAAEVVAALKQGESSMLPEDARECVGDLRIAADEELISQGVAALDRILENSELKELWEDSSDLADWQAAIENLRGRLLV